MSKYLPLLIPAIAAILPTVSTEVAAAIGAFVSHNVALASYLVAGAWAVFHLLPSPIQEQIVSKDIPKV